MGRWRKGVPVNNIVIRNETLSLGLSTETGAVISLESRLTGWKILDRPKLGLSFRLLLPLSEELRNNQVLGERQKPCSIREAKDGRSVRITWDSLVSERGGRHPICVSLEIRMEERAAVFTMDIENRSSFVVENVYCPYLGDLRSPPTAPWFRTFLHNYGTAQEWGLRLSYQNLRGYYGSDHPIQFSPTAYGCGSPMSPYILLRGPGEGLYAGTAEDTTELVAWNTELRPGYGSSIDSRVPEDDVISGQDAAIRFAAVHVPYIMGGQKRRLTPVALEAYGGDWQAGVDIHRRLFALTHTPAKAPAWAREPHSWMQLQINSPEDELRMRFTDLPRVGEECARHGVKAIQLVGWNEGGQDQGNPSHDPDPRLGTFQEFKAAIAEIQAMGVKLILFAKFTWADRATERFRKELHKLAVKDPYGDYYLHAGYQYQTATQFLDINTKRLIPMCFHSEEYMRLCDQEFTKILDLGADGFLFDECLHHASTLCCFDESHGHRYGAPVYANDNLLIERFARMAIRKKPDFLFAGEACYDREMAVYHLSYHRSENKLHVPLSRYSLPRSQYMTAVTGFNDRNMVAQCLLYRYIISYEPFNFKGRLEDFPLTLEYGKKMDALRSELRDYFWDGEFRHELGATVECRGVAHHPFSVFLNARNGKPGLVVANYEDEEVEVSARVQNSALSKWRTIEDPLWRSFCGNVRIPARSCVVITG
jgi:hypothetical protein